MKYISDEKGFSLAELMIIVAIIGIALTMSYSGIVSQGDKFKFENEVLKVRAVLLSARNRALVSGECVRATVDPINKTITVNRYRPSNKCLLGEPSYHLGQSDQVTLHSNVQVTEIDIPTGIHSHLVNQVVFSPQGGTFYSRPVITTLKNTITSRTQSVHVYPAIGQVVVR